MAEETRSIFNLNESFYENMKKAVNAADSFEKQVQSVKKAINEISELEIKVKNEEALKKIIKTNKTLNDIKKNVSIIIGAKDTASESLKNIKNNVKSIVSKPFDIVIKARDKTKDTIDKIKNNLISAKEKVSKVFVNDFTKAAAGVTFGEAIKSEKNMSLLKTNLQDDSSAHEAMGWANKISRQTHLTSNESVESVMKLAEKGLDYKKFFMTSGNLAAAKNKSMDEVISSMGKLSSGDVGGGISDLKSLGVTKEMWEKQGIKFDGEGNALSSSKEATEAIRKIVDENWKNAMSNKSKNVDGQIKNIKDSVFSMGKNLIGVTDNGYVETGGVFDVFKEQLENVLKLLDKFKESDAFKNIKKSLADIVSNYGTKFTKFLEDVMSNPDKYKKKFEDFKRSIASGIKDAKDLGSAIKSVAEALKPVFSLMKNHPVLSIGALLGGKALKGGIGNYKEIKEISKDMKKLKNSFKGFGAGGKGIFKSLKDPFKGFSKNAKNFKKRIPRFFKDIAGTTKLWSGMIGKVLKNNFTRSLKTFKSTFKGVKIGKTFKDAFKGIKDLGIMKELPKALSAAAKPFKTLGKVIVEVFTTIFKTFKRAFGLMLKNPMTLIILAIIAVIIILYKAWTENWGGIRDKTKAIVEFLTEKFNSFMETVKKIKDSVVSFAKDVIENFRKVRDFFADPIDATIRVFKENTSAKGYEQNPAKKVGGKALGTSYFEGGWTWVGEHGPELMKLPGGAKILDNRTSTNMCGGAFSIEKLADTLVVREDADIDRIANALVKKLEKTGYNMA